jgi:transposase InsO family protein
VLVVATVVVMAGKAVPMDVRLRIAVASEGLNVSAFCRDQGISRETFYAWRRRYRLEGSAGLEAKSRAPRAPKRIDAAVEDEIVRLRKQLADEGLDHGPTTIQWHLGRQRPKTKVPSVATVWRVLQRHGFIDPEPRKRPKVSWRRFEASAPNELWQCDFIEWTIATGVVKVFSFLDDHSRVALRLKAAPHATSEAAWMAFSEAAAAWGVPLGQLSDNGLCFSGKLRGFEVHFETQLRGIGVVPKTSRPFHPQTCGKVERFQQTLKKWLARQRLAGDVTELQDQLDRFADIYNHHRPHQGIGRATPAQRWAATPPAVNLGVALPSPARRVDAVVLANGIVKVRPWDISIGKRWARQQALVHIDDRYFAVFIDHQLVAAGALDHNRRYQPLRPRTPPN